MNKHLYRIVFNRALGVLQVVAEIVRQPGANGPAQAGTTTAVLRPVSFALWMALGYVALAHDASAQVVADPNAPGNQRPTVITAPSGAPLVNITTPSAAGVSRNTYRQFDVGAQGVVLNNSRTGAQTQLGGPVQGNPWLVGGTARIILNEVNSANPSHLNGYVEVAGDRAQVVIANPAGIQVNGGGFLNASRATLTTGTPIVNGGALEGYRVQGGAIRVEGAGLDASQTDYTDLIARSMEVNAGIWARQLQATLGVNTVSADQSAITRDTDATTAPSFALDVSQLGGMYANKIVLVGTENGVGVRSAGEIGAQAGELEVTVDGRIENTGKLQAQTNTRVEAGGGVANAGTISAGREVAVATSSDLNNDGGTLNAQRIEVTASALTNRGGAIEQTGSQALALDAGTVRNRDGGRIGIAESLPTDPGTVPGPDGGSSGSGGGTGGAGPGTGGGDGVVVPLPVPEPLADGALRVAGTLDNDGGVINAGGGVLLTTANGLDNSGGRLGLRDLVLTQGDLGNVGGELNVAGNATLQVGRINNDAGRFEIAGALQVDAQTLSNRGGTLTQGGAGASSIRIVDKLDNTEGALATNASALTLDSTVLVNEHGRIEHAGTGGLTVNAEALRGAEGRIATAGALTLDAGQVDHRGATLSTTQVAITALDFDNRGGQVLASGANANTVDVTGTFDNSDDGVLASQGDLTLRAGTFGNAGGTVQQAGTGTLAIDARTLNGAGGTIASNGALTIAGTTTDLRDGITAAQSVSIDTGALVTAGGELTAAGKAALRLTVRDRLDNSAGQIATNGEVRLQAGALTNTGGTISAAGAGASALHVDDALDNRSGVIATTGALDVQAGNLDNTDGTLQVASEDGLAIAAGGRVTNDGGAIESNGAIDLTAQAFSNAEGTLQTARAITARVTGAFDNTAGTVAAGGDLTIDADALFNRDTFDPSNADPSAQKGLFGQKVTLRAEAFDNTRGQLHAADALALRGRTRNGAALTNVGGVIDGNGAVTVSATTFDNAAGTLVQRGTGGALSLTADGLLGNTAGGLIGAEGEANLQAGAIDNTAGTIFAAGDLAAASLGDSANRHGGLFQSNGDLTVSAGGAFDNTDGTLDASGRGTMAAARIDNVRGQVLAGGVADGTSLTVNTSVLNNQGGTIGTRDGDLALNVVSIGNIAGGKLVAQRDIAFTTTNAVNNAGGTVFAARNLAYENAAGTLDNAGGQFGAGESARIALANVSNTNSGRIQAGTVWLTTPHLDLSGGEVAANTLHANLATLTGLGRLYGAQWLDVDFSGDFAYENGQRFESDALLDLAAAGAFTNRGTLQTAGELALSAASLSNHGTINASNADGTGLARINIAGTIDNQRGASLEGDTLVLTATDVTNTGDIVGDAVAIDADTLTNGRDLGTAMAAVDYGEGFIGAADYLDLRIGQRLANLDGDLFSAGDLTIAGRTDGGRVVRVDNVSGRIQAEGDLTIAADQLVNERRMIATETYNLSPEEQYALGSQRQFDEAFAALTDAERQRLQYLNSRGAGDLSAAEILEKKALNHKVGWQTVDHVSDEMLAAINDWYTNVAAPEHGAYEGYVIDNAATAADNPGAEVIQRDTYTSGERLIAGATSAAGQIVSGGDMTLDVAQRVRNHASQIAAGGYLTIAGQHYTGASEDSDARIDTIAVAGQLTGERETQAWVYPEIPTMYRDYRGWNRTVAEVIGYVHEDITSTGPTLLTASITAGQGLSIQAGDVTNTAVSNGGGLSDFNGGSLSGPGSTGLGTAGGIAGATGPGGPAGVGSQVVGTPERPLPGLVPSDNGMFDIHADPNAEFLVTTAPRFAKGDGTGSNYLMDKLGVTTDLHKRLGDGYYEQRLVLEQILSLTGRRSLTGNGDGFEQYRMLMDHAADEAARLGFALGAPLTSAQIAALNQDIVWLVEQEVNGQKVLVPVVYLSKATAEKMKSAGALMAGDTVDIQSSGTVRNDGTLDSTRGTWLSADALINDGAIRSEGRVDIATAGNTVNRGKLIGNTIAIDAGGDVINTVRFDGVNASGGVIRAGAGGAQVNAGRDVVNQGTITSDGHAVVSAGRDFVQNAATADTKAGGVKAPAGSIASTGSTVVTAGQDVVLDESSLTAGQHVVIDAGRDAKFIASDVSVDGSIAVTAGRDIVSETVSDSITVIEQTSTREGKKRTRTTTTTTDEIVTGSTFQAGGDIAMVADRDIDLAAAMVHSDAGAVALSAGRDVNLRVAYETDSTRQDSVSKKRNTLSKTTTTTHYEASDTTAVGTTLSGDRVSVAAGRDITAQTAAVVATHDVAMAAGRNLTLTTAEETHTESYSTSTKKSGVFGAGAGFTVGQQKVQQGYELTETTHQGTVIGALGGSVSLSAGNAVHATGSDVLSEMGTAIIGKSVTIDAAVDTTELTQTYKQSSAGLHVGLKGGAVSALEAAYAKGKAADEVDDDRLKALYAAQAGMAAKDAYDGAKAMANGTSAKDAGISLRIGIGASSASAQTTATNESAKGSRIESNGGVSIAATDGHLNVVGSQVDGRTVALAATGNINLRGQEEEHTTASRNKSGSAEVGVSIGSTTGFYVSADVGRGKASGNGTTHAETVVRGREGVSFVSGGDTTLEGAQLIGERIVGQVGGNFNVISQQDTDDYSSKQQQAGGEFVWGGGGSAYYGQQTADSHYRSVQEQSGVQAGGGGFQIDVAGNTHLKGGALASTAAPDQNRLTTGSLSIEHLENQATAEAEGHNLGADSNMFSGGKYAAAQGMAQNLMGSGDDADQRNSTTRADIADGSVVIRNGDTTALAELARTATTLDGNGVAPLDLQELQEQVAWEQAVKGEVYTQAIKFTDEAYRTMFLEEVKVYVVEKDSEGNQLPPRELTQEEKFNLKPAADGKVHVADNGINNDLNGANKYAEKHSTADGPQYFIHFPKAENGLSELLIAGYQKYLESDALGLANATDLTREYMLLYGQDGLHLDGHSRGSLTVGNAMESLENLSNSSGLMSGSTVSFFGPAYNAAAADALLSHLQNRDSWANPQDGVLTLQNHENDIVGGWIGLNPSTAGVTPEGGNTAWEMARVLGGTNTPHNCYSASTSKCQDLWSDQPGRQSSPVPIDQVPMSRAEEIMYRLESWRGSFK